MTMDTLTHVDRVLSEFNYGMSAYFYTYFNHTTVDTVISDFKANDSVGTIKILFDKLKKNNIDLSTPEMVQLIHNRLATLTE